MNSQKIIIILFLMGTILESFSSLEGFVPDQSPTPDHPSHIAPLPTCKTDQKRETPFSGEDLDAITEKTNKKKRLPDKTAQREDICFREPEFKGNWSKEFYLKDGRTTVFHTPSIVDIGGLQGTELEIKGPEINRMKLSSPGLSIKVDSSPEEFLEALKNSDLYKPELN